MTQLRCFLLAIACLALLLSGVIRGEDPKKTSPAEIERLIKQLGSDEFEKREAASKALEAVGEPALELLRSAATKSDDAELRRRAEKLVEALDPNLYRQVRCLVGHTYSVSSVAFSPDGKRALSGGVDETARLWDVETGKELRRFSDDAYVRTVAFAPDGKRGLLGCSDFTMRLWDVKSGKELRRFQCSRRDDGADASVVAIAPDGKRALSGSLDRVSVVRLWDLESGKELRRFQGHTDKISSVTFAPDGKRAASASFDGTVRLWDVETGKELRCFKCDSAVLSLALSPDGKWAVSAAGYDPSMLLVWDVESGKELRRMKGHKGPIWCVAFCPDGKRVVSGGYDATVRVWNPQTGRELHCFTDHTESVNSVAVSPDGKWALSGSGDKTVRLWKLSNEPDSAKRVGPTKEK